MAKILVRDPFNPIFFFSEDPEKYIEEESIICILTSYKHNQEILEIKEDERILPLLWSTGFLKIQELKQTIHGLTKP